MRFPVYHPCVPSEVRKVVEYYEEISPKLADEFWIELTEAIDYATEHPEHHHFDPTGFRRSNLKRFPYHFLFRVFCRFYSSHRGASQSQKPTIRITPQVGANETHWLHRDRLQAARAAEEVSGSMSTAPRKKQTAP